MTRLTSLAGRGYRATRRGTKRVGRIVRRGFHGALGAPRRIARSVRRRRRAGSR